MKIWVFANHFMIIYSLFSIKTKLHYFQSLIYIYIFTKLYSNKHPRSKFQKVEFPKQTQQKTDAAPAKFYHTGRQTHYHAQNANALNASTLCPDASLRFEQHKAHHTNVQQLLTHIRVWQNIHTQIYSTTGFQNKSGKDSNSFRVCVVDGWNDVECLRLHHLCFGTRLDFNIWPSLHELLFSASSTTQRLRVWRHEWRGEGGTGSSKAQISQSHICLRRRHPLQHPAPAAPPSGSAPSSSCCTSVPPPSNLHTERFPLPWRLHLIHTTFE